MAKIEELTQEQQDRLPKIREEWLKIGLSTEPTDFEYAKECVNMAYDAAKVPKPTEWHLSDSPDSAARHILGIKWKPTDEKNIKHTLSEMSYGCHDAPTLAFYAAFLEFGFDCVEPMRGLIELAKCCGWWTAFELKDKMHCVLQHRPSAIHLDDDNRLHKDGDYAISYQDGWGIAALHGVKVPKWLAFEPAGKIKVEKIHEIENAQVRTEFVRKIGIERVLGKLSDGAVDTLGDYELHFLKLSDTQERKYLKMKNPSVPELWHVEAVPPDVNTVAEALMFRNGISSEQIDDTDGEDWYQQGDVLLFPDGAKKLKSYPRQIS